MRAAWLVMVLLLLGCRHGGPDQDRPLRVAAAADLQDAFTELAALFYKDTGRRVALSFGASGILTHQVRQGAPFDLLATASPHYIDELDRLDRLVPRSRVIFARGQLALWLPADSTVADLAGLQQPRVRRVALANPEHAPYGQAAMAALRTAGLWEPLRRKLVYAENVRQALQFGASGNADAALVAQALCTDHDRCTAVPPALYPPIEQALGILRGGDKRGAARFCALLFGDAGRAILQRHGYQLPPRTP